MLRQELRQVAQYGDQRYYFGLFSGLTISLWSAWLLLEFVINPVLLDTVIESANSGNIPNSLISLGELLLRIEQWVFYLAIGAIIVTMYFYFKSNQLDSWTVHQ